MDYFDLENFLMHEGEFSGEDLKKTGLYSPEGSLRLILHADAALQLKEKGYNSAV